jgi:Predicted xylanase/chitin deacetylase
MPEADIPGKKGAPVRIVALKVYCDSVRGHKEGMPRFLDALEELGIPGSFFFGMGGEGTGSLASKLFGEGKEIVASAPAILRDATRRGFDCGIYGWNPAEWERRLEKRNDTTLEAEIKRAVEQFTRRAGRRPNGFAAPGCRVTYISLRVQDEMHFRYCSDTFGLYPFFPKMSWKTFATPQIPATVPPLEVALARASRSEAAERLSALLHALPDGLSVIPANAAIGTSPEIFSPLREFLMRMRDEGGIFWDMNRVIESIDVETLLSCEVETVKVPGMPREVAVQRLD